MLAIGIVGIILEVFIVFMSAYLYVSMTALEVREDEASRAFWWKLFVGWITVTYFLLFCGTCFFLMSFMYVVFIFSPSLFQWVLIMDMFATAIMWLVIFLVCFAVAHAVYLSWKKLGKAYKKFPLADELSAEEQEPIFAAWTCDETAAWVRGGQAPAKLLGAYSIGPVTGCDRAGH
jgi:hypothetical protein